MWTRTSRDGAARRATPSSAGPAPQSQEAFVLHAPAELPEALQPPPNAGNAAEGSGPNAQEEFIVPALLNDGAGRHRPDTSDKPTATLLFALKDRRSHLQRRADPVRRIDDLAQGFRPAGLFHQLSAAARGEAPATAP